MKMGRSYCQTHRESHSSSSRFYSCVASFSSLFLILQPAASPFWFTLTSLSVVFHEKHEEVFSDKALAAPKKKRKIPMRTFYSLRKREPNNNRKKTAGNLKNQFILSVIFWADLSNICWFQLLRCKNLLLFFVIYESKGRVLGFGNVLVTDWFIDNKNMC